MTGDNTKKLDGPERADLLCFLVMAQLIGHATTGSWLRTDHVVEASRMWAASNASDCDWLERAKLAQMSADLAPQFRVFPRFLDPAEILKLFTEGWQLDYQSPIVCGMPDVCTERLLQHR
jgi:hypothetical protein